VCAYKIRPFKNKKRLTNIPFEWPLRLLCVHNKETCNNNNVGRYLCSRTIRYQNISCIRACYTYILAINKQYAYLTRYNCRNGRVFNTVLFEKSRTFAGVFENDVRTIAIRIRDEFSIGSSGVYDTQIVLGEGRKQNAY